MDTEFAAVRAVLQTYLDGLHHSDTERLGQVFHPQARYVCATVEPLVNLDMATYFPIVDARPSWASRGDARRDVVQSIDFAGPNTAFARLTCVIDKRFFTDFLTLIRTDGAWRIIAKVFHYDPLPADAGTAT